MDCHLSWALRIKEVFWQLLPSGWIKLFYGQGSCSMGNFAIKLGVNTVFEAEMLGAINAVEIACNMNWNN